MRHEPIPETITSSWKSPPAGYRTRNPKLALRLEAEFLAAPDPGRLEIWRVLRGVLELLGDHRAELHIGNIGRPGRLHETDLPWRSRQYGTVLTAPLSWFAGAGNWGALEPMWETSWWICAYRGGGKHRHQVWSFHFTHHPRSPAKLSIDITTRHIATEQIAGLSGLIRLFFQRAERAGCCYGRGDLGIPTKPWRDVELDTKRFRDVWQHAERAASPVVPGVHRYNFLSAPHLERLGGIERLGGLASRLQEHHLESEPIGAGALVTTEPIRLWSVHEFASPDAEDDAPLEAIWLLSEFSRAGMLAVQQMGWIEKEITRVGESQKERQENEGMRKRARRGRSVASWLKELRVRPPRCVRTVAKPALGTARWMDEGSGGHGEEAVTQFEIEGPGGKRRLTLYGAPSGDDELLYSPILAGSMKRERAVFVFDVVRDGWVGESSPPEFPNEARRVRQFVCPRCDGRVFEVTVAFEYPEDLDELEEEQKGHAEDFFSWFWLRARCPACGWDGLVADVECA